MYVYLYFTLKYMYFYNYTYTQHISSKIGLFFLFQRKQKIYSWSWLSPEDFSKNLILPVFPLGFHGIILKRPTTLQVLKFITNYSL